jgi:hypothetical protein
MKKILLLLAVFVLCISSVAFGYVFGGTNLDFMGYPEFSAYLSYDPSRSEVERYIQEAKEYVENGNNDIRRIREAQNEAIRKANDAVRRHNSGY